MSRLLANAGPYTLTHTWYVDGTATNVGDVTVGIVDGSGSAVVTPGTATTNNGDGTYTYSLSDQTTPDILVSTWTRSDTSASVVSHLEVVGSHLFTEPMARAYGAKDDGTAPLSSATEYADATILDGRDRITDELEEWTGRSWIRRYCRAEFAGDGTRSLYLQDGIPRLASGYPLHRRGRIMDVVQLLSVSVGGTSVATTNFKVGSGGLISRTSGVFSSATSSSPLNVVVEWEYGLPFPVDGADRVGMALLVDRLVPSAYPERAISWDSEFGTVRMVTEGGPMMNRTRIPHVNQWLRDHDYRSRI